MKIYNPFKKIKELNEELVDLKNDNSILRRKIESMEENKEKHECGFWCDGCKNLIEEDGVSVFGVCKSKFCILDNPCKDRETKNE